MPLTHTYTFHYLTRATAFFVLAYAMAIFAYTLHLNQIEGVPAMVFFVGGCCIILGEIVRTTVGKLNHLAVRDGLTGIQ
ncbi:hypothetical protein MNBD_GAMMA05-1022 [hydrothermal vent metagenome]|uniref:Uncharacterized protein n=1 Tax=hydrothermal vent metagenome TaxID=652676 RepID=A0A3B0W5G7_9ZZZZ